MLAQYVAYLTPARSALPFLPTALPTLEGWGEEQEQQEQQQQQEEEEQ